MTSLNLELAGRTDPGCIRSNNEDSLVIDQRLGLFAVADGMGGHNSGEVASALAVETLRDSVRRIQAGKEDIPGARSDAGRSVKARELEHAIRAANRVIFEKGKGNSRDQGMGTTIVAGYVDESRGILTIGHVGDSRLYVFRNGHLELLTQDHSLVMDQLRRGMLSEEEAQNSHLQNVLTRALGSEPEVSIDVSEHPTLQGDIILLCTDGLTRMVTDGGIREILGSSDSPAGACKRLIEAALQAGGADNVTVVVGKIYSKPCEGISGVFRRIRSKLGAWTHGR